jgi:deoxyribodipyrimidine photolyase-related protein
MNHPMTLRLILGDQLNEQHTWFNDVSSSVTYVMMEVRTETDYAQHHIQKVLGFFSAMRHFANWLRSKNHQVIYLKLTDDKNLQSFSANIQAIISSNKFEKFEYQLPDEYRLDQELNALCTELAIPFAVMDSEHFYTSRNELGDFFQGKKTFIMESFYRKMRTKHNVLMNGSQPVSGKWNYDDDNRKKTPKNHVPTAPLVFNNDVSDIHDELIESGIKTIGNCQPKAFIWPVNRKQSLTLLAYFIDECLPLFGTFQDAMGPNLWSIYHARLSFSMNTKMLSPKEVIAAAIAAWEANSDTISYNQLEGFVRQIIGWREYMRGIYWNQMPAYQSKNFFNHQNKLPEWFWTGKTKLNCLKDAINQSLDYAYAHHIQRLMITGNFALLAGVHPDEVDAWYLGIYIDAIEWVEITNTRGMSQFADGGIVATKPYVSSATYIDKMSHYCGTCYYSKAIKVGEKACPFNSLYWNFYDQHEALLAKNPRIGMMYSVWRKMAQEDKTALLEQADYYLTHINEL